MCERGGRLWLLVSVAALASAAGVARAFPVDARVQAVIDRSKRTQQTYALYDWEKVSRPGQPVAEHWSAEFNQGPQHRVETPEVRAVANCETGAGSSLLVALGRTESSPDMARTACGISTRAPFTDETWLGEVETPFGKADRIQLTDAQLIRTYDVTRDGVIVRTVFQALGPGRPEVLSSHAVAVLPEVPAGNLFDDASLQKSFVPEAYKVAPGPESLR